MSVKQKQSSNQKKKKHIQRLKGRNYAYIYICISG